VLAEWERFDAEQARAKAEEAELATTCLHRDGYPQALRDLAGPPAALYCNDRARLADEVCVSVVGARRASAYGLEVARGLGRGLAAAQVTVVSGMALGIDSAAHAGALETSGRTIAVLAGGADVPYPRSKRALHARLLEDACVAAELPPGTPPRKWGFPARNRIIAALGQMTVVVEAAQRSGALITARIARELGREVGAVPGRVSSPMAAGSNALIRDGAHLVDGPQAVLDVLFGAGVRRAEPNRRARDLEPRLAEVLGAVAEGRDTVAALARTPEEAGDVMAALAELELNGLVGRVAGGHYVPLA
jgi:DNA processing protein